MTDDIKAIARRAVEMFSSGDFSIADEIYSEDYVGHDPTKPEPIRGIAGAKEPVLMAEAMRLGVEAGRKAFLAGRMPRRDYANASSPTAGLIE